MTRRLFLLLLIALAAPAPAQPTTRPILVAWSIDPTTDKQFPVSEYMMKNGGGRVKPAAFVGNRELNLHEMWAKEGRLADYKWDDAKHKNHSDPPTWQGVKAYARLAQRPWRYGRLPADEWVPFIFDIEGAKKSTAATTLAAARWARSVLGEDGELWAFDMPWEGLTPGLEAEFYQLATGPCLQFYSYKNHVDSKWDTFWPLVRQWEEKYPGRKLAVLNPRLCNYGEPTFNQPTPIKVWRRQVDFLRRAPDVDWQICVWSDSGLTLPGETEGVKPHLDYVILP